MASVHFAACFLVVFTVSNFVSSSTIILPDHQPQLATSRPFDLRQQQQSQQQWTNQPTEESLTEQQKLKMFNDAETIAKELIQGGKGPVIPEFGQEVIGRAVVSENGGFSELKPQDGMQLPQIIQFQTPAENGEPENDQYGNGDKDDDEIRIRNRRVVILLPHFEEDNYYHAPPPPQQQQNDKYNSYQSTPTFRPAKRASSGLFAPVYNWYYYGHLR